MKNCRVYSNTQSSGKMTLSFNQQQIQQLFPFHLLLNADLEIISSGNSMVKVMPALRLGTAISQYFALEHSGFADTFSQAITQSTSFIIKSTSSNHYFMMQPVCFENGDVLLAGKPVINNNFSLTDYNLTINDFASKDNVVEQLFLIQATKKSLSDATTLNQEITAKNRALSQINERYEMVVNGVHDIIFQTDNDGNWIFLNKAWVTIMGFSLEETLCRPFFKYLHPDDVEKNMKLFTPLIERKKEYCSHQIRYIAKNGSIRWIKVYAVLTFDDNGNITGTSGTLQDITEQKESFEKYELLANNILDIVSIADLNAACVYVSPSIKSITGYDPATHLDQLLFGMVSAFQI